MINVTDNDSVTSHTQQYL